MASDEGGVGVDGPHQVFDGAFELHGGNGFGDELRRLRADDVHAEDLSVLGVGDDLHEAVVRVDDGGLGVSDEGELAHLDVWPSSLALASVRPTLPICGSV